MSCPPPIFPETRFSFPEHFYHAPEAPEPRPPASDFFARPPNNFTGVSNNFNTVPSAAAVASSNAQFFLPQATVSTTMAPDANEIFLDVFPPDVVEQLLEGLKAEASSQVAPSIATDSFLTVPHGQPHAAPPKNSLQSTTMAPALHYAGQGHNLTPTIPSVPPTPTDEASASVIPPANSLKRRRARNDSMAGEDIPATNNAKEDISVKSKVGRKPVKSKATKVLSNMYPPPVPVSTSATLSFFGNIPPPDGPAVASSSSAPAPASDEGRPAKRQRKQSKAKSSNKAPQAPPSGIRAMQTVFRATPATGSAPRQPQLPSPNGQQVQPHVQFPPQDAQRAQLHMQFLPQNGQQTQPHTSFPSFTQQGMALLANGQHARGQMQNNGSVAGQHPRPLLQQPVSALAPSSRMQCLTPLEPDIHAEVRIMLAMKIVRKTGNLGALFHLLCYRRIQELLKNLLLMGIQKKWVLRRPHGTGPFHYVPNIRKDGYNPPNRVNNNIQSTSRAGFRLACGDDNANIRISQSVRHSVVRPGAGQDQMQMGMIPQNVGGRVCAVSNLSDVPGNGRDMTRQSTVGTRQVPHDTSFNFFDSHGSLMGGPVFEGGAAQPAQQAAANAHNVGYQNSSAPGNDVNGVAGPSRFTASAYDVTGPTWDDAISVNIVSQTDQMGALSQTPISVDPLCHGGAGSVNLEGNATTITEQVTADKDPHLVGATEKNAPEATPSGVTKGSDNINPDESTTNKPKSSESSTSADCYSRSRGLESFEPTYTDALAINRALYGDGENSWGAIPFHMPLGNNEETLFPGTGQGESSSAATGDPAGQASFDLGEFVNFDL